jgi:hypothetical protein
MRGAHLALRASATTPAARGALADVPVCNVVQRFFRSVVTYMESAFSRNMPYLNVFIVLVRVKLVKVSG